MRRSLAVLLGLGVLVGTAPPVQGQTWKFDIGVNGGGSWWTTLADEDELGSGKAAFATSWLVGAQATGWLWPRVGLRLNFPYEDRALEARDGEFFAGEEGALDHVNIWGPSLDLLFRLKQPATDFVRGEWLPYIAVGGGIRYVNPAGDRYIAIDEVNAEYWAGVPFGMAEAGADTLFLSELSTAMGLVGLGTDVRLSPGFALRLEVGDRISKPYAYLVTPRSDPLRFDAVNGRENDASLSHEIYGTLGLHLTFGGARAAAPVVVQAPPPPPPPPPPAAPPAPREESVNVCVIDATSAGGVRTVTATYLPASGDTMVTVNGQRVAFRTTVTEGPVAANADWLVAGSPLEVTLRPAPARFLAVGQTRAITDGSLVLLGTVNGQHVYAERSSVSAVADRFGTTAELATTLGNAELRRAFDEVQVLYVPFRTVGCTFQPLQRQEEVRKAR